MERLPSAGRCDPGAGLRALQGDSKRQLLPSMLFHCGSGIAKSWGATRRWSGFLPQEGASGITVSASVQIYHGITLVFQPVGVILASRAFRFDDSGLIE